MSSCAAHLSRPISGKLPETEQRPGPGEPRRAGGGGRRKPPQAAQRAAQAAPAPGERRREGKEPEATQPGPQARGGRGDPGPGGERRPRAEQAKGDRPGARSAAKPEASATAGEAAQRRPNRGGRAAAEPTAAAGGPRGGRAAPDRRAARAPGAGAKARSCRGLRPRQGAGGDAAPGGGAARGASLKRAAYHGSPEQAQRRRDRGRRPRPSLPRVGEGAPDLPSCGRMRTHAVAVARPELWRSL